MRVRRERLREVGTDPDYRFSLANERTFLAWVRTALALIAAGLVLVQLLPPFPLPGAREFIGVGLVAFGTILAATSYWRWMRNERALRTGTALPPSRLPLLVAVGVTVLAAAALVGLFVEL